VQGTSSEDLYCIIPILVIYLLTYKAGYLSGDLINSLCFLWDGMIFILF
jgi:hypothetical protein